MEDQDQPLNPSQQVERIREILVGREMNQVEDRLRQLEGAVASQDSQVGSGLLQRVKSSQVAVIEETQQLRRELQQETKARREQVDGLGQQLEATCRDLQQHDKQLQHNLSAHLENISAAMAARIDARVREILQHLLNEIVKWKNQIEHDLQGVRDQTVSRTELKSRLGRLASAAMEDPGPEDGYLL